MGEIFSAGVNLVYFHQDYYINYQLSW